MVSSSKPVDFCRGIADLAHSVEKDDIPILSADLGVHVCEIIENLQYPLNQEYKTESSFPKINLS